MNLLALPAEVREGPKPGKHRMLLAKLLLPHIKVDGSCKFWYLIGTESSVLREMWMIPDITFPANVASAYLWREQNKSLWRQGNSCESKGATRWKAHSAAERLQSSLKVPLMREELNLCEDSSCMTHGVYDTQDRVNWAARDGWN